MKTKILFILHYPPPVHGAAMVGQYIRESTVINDSFTTEYINLGTSINIDEIGKGSWGKWKRYFFILKNTLNKIKSFKPDLVYLTLTSTGGGFYKDAIVAILAKSLGQKVIYHFHNKGVSQKKDTFLYNSLYKIVFRNSEVILLSKHLYADVKKYVPEERVHYCPNGIPPIADLNNKFLKSNHIEILFLSNLIESKGVFVLLEACKILQKKNLNFHCTFVGGVGDVSEQKFNKKVEALNLQKSVNYLGKKYGREKEEIFLNADIFTLPTYYHNECFPLVLLEAMQYSLPIVSTFEGGIQEIVDNKKTGFLVPQKDAVALAEKLELLIVNGGLREELGAEGSKKYQREFTLAIFERRFTNVLIEILEGKESAQQQIL